jgi:TonB family protein
MFLGADIVVQAVMVGLVFASVATWTVLLAKSVTLARTTRRQRRAFAVIAKARSLSDAAHALRERSVGAALIEAASWQSTLLGHLERHKRCPKAARWRRQEGVAYVWFTMDRDGRVLGSRLERSSGAAALDEETLELIKRAEPLPKPPAEVAGETMQLVVPVQFLLR